MKHLIGISAGDPSGISLEVILKAMPSMIDEARWVLYTDASAFDRHYPRFASGIPFRWIQDPKEAGDSSALHLIEVPGASCPIPWGDVQKAGGERALAYLEAASDAAVARDIVGIVTGPVHKAAIGNWFKGQTEFLAERAQTSRFAMAFFAPTFKVVLATVHLPLREALEKLSTSLYVDLIHLVAEQLHRFGFEAPSIAVAAVNPHAGEDGMFGSEDQKSWRPRSSNVRTRGFEYGAPTLLTVSTIVRTPESSMSLLRHTTIRDWRR
jgi:4-hydroxythreonine-4-phosphate dehydrogenase